MGPVTAVHGRLDSPHHQPVCTKDPQSAQDSLYPHTVTQATLHPCFTVLKQAQTLRHLPRSHSMTGIWAEFEPVVSLHNLKAQALVKQSYGIYQLSLFSS